VKFNARRGDLLRLPHLNNYAVGKRCIATNNVSPDEILLKVSDEHEVDCCTDDPLYGSRALAEDARIDVRPVWTKYTCDRDRALAGYNGPCAGYIV